MAFTLVIGDKNLSSWSLRPWLLMRMLGVPFEERQVRLDRPESRGEILRHSPAGRVPILLHDDLAIWDSLAIVEYLAELEPGRVWPQERARRARARSLACEMHAGFADLRRELPMDIRARKTGQRWSEAAASDLRRIAEIWSGAEGPFLFGGFGAVDAMYAPVATRCVTYGVRLPPAAAAYRDAILALPPMREWAAAAARE
jgi:glutathione S-transferase